jgi:CubicO group peptidase (beta-lactamase class C family)
MRLRSLALPFAFVAAAFATSSSALSASGAPPVTVDQPQTPAATPSPATPTHPLEKADLEAWLDGFVPYALKNGDIAGAVVAVVKDGHVLVEKGYGDADVARKIPMDPEHTLVRIGSTSKLFTWTAVMQLVEQHKLDLDRDINDYLDFKVASKTGAPITLRDLMNHRAGFEEGLKDVLAVDPHALQTTEQYLKAHPRPMLFAPGEVPAYSNYGAALAGYIVQRVSGERFEDYVARHILAPLDMQHTTFEQPLPEKFRAAMANGYRTASSEPHPYEFVVTAPAGSAAATADDMTRFMIAQLQLGRFGDNRILSADTARLMQTPSETGLPGFSTMAHGFFYDRHNGHVVIGHGGDTVVFHTELDLLPADGVGIFYNFTSRGKNDAVYGARELLFDEFMNRYFPAPVQAPLPTLSSAPHDAQEIAGLYESSRRIEHGFLGFFYLLQQSSIGANAGGTITAPPGPGRQSDATFREIGPQIWREKNGTRELALRDVSGVKTVIDSTDPTSVLQAVPFFRSQSLNLTVLLVSVAILFWSLVLWLVSPLLRRGEPAQSEATGMLRRLRLYTRCAALVDIVYLGAWTILFLPILSLELETYGTRLDPVVLTLECSGLLAIAAAGVGVWSTWRMFKEGAPLLSKIWSVAVSAALLGVVWIGAMGGLIAINLNY